VGLEIDPGTFEAGVAAWTATDSSVVQSGAQANSGSFSALLTVIGTPAQAYMRAYGASAVPISPGVDYRTTMWVRSPDALEVLPAVDIYDAGSGYIGGAYPSSQFLVPNTWTQLTLDFTAIPLSAFAVYGPTIVGGTNGQELYVDDVFFDFVPVVAPAAPGPMPIRQELLIDGVWTDYTTRTRSADQVRIVRGYSGEQASLSAGTCSFKLDNADGLFTNTNPNSALYGLVGKNTQYRCSIVEETNFLRMANTVVPSTGAYDGARAWTVDKAVLDITGDIEVRWDGEADRWTGVPGAILASKYFSVGDQRSWMLFTDTFGYLYFTWSTNGTAANRRTAKSTVTLPAGAGRLALRATLDVDNGAAGCTVTFYTSDTIAGSWTILGAAVTAAGTTSVHGGTSDVEIGTANEGQGWNVSFTLVNLFSADVDPFVGKVYGFELYNGIGGTLVADFDATAQAVGDTSWSDGLGTPNTWTLEASAEISDADYRFWGELTASPKGADGTSTDVYVDVTASDLIARLSDTNKPVRSAITTNLASSARDGYWTMEQEPETGTSTTVISATYGQPGRVVDGTFSSTTDFPGTAGSLAFSSDTGFATGTATFDGANTGIAYALWYFKLPSVPVSPVTIMRVMMTGGNVYRVDINATSTGFQLRAYNSDSTLLGSGDVLYGTGILPTSWLAIRTMYTQDGANIDWDLTWYPVGGESLAGTSGTFAGTIGRPRAWYSNGFTGKSGMELAHVVLDREDVGFTSSSFIDSTNAYDGEHVYDRWRRLGVQFNISLAYRGFHASGSPERKRTVAMGPQLPRTPIALLTECADADGGMIFAPRNGFGIELRPIVSMINQDALELDYSAQVLSGVIRPDPDAFRVRNDVTATKTDGSSARWIKTSGPNNTSEPADDPQGVGTYDVAVPKNVETSDQLLAAAQWETALGTWAEDRYPQITLETHRQVIATDATLLAAVRKLDIGAAFTLTGLPSWLPPGDVYQYARGYNELLQNFTQTITFNAAPYGPYRTGIWGGTARRVDSGTTTIAEDLDTTETGINISTTNRGDIWTTTVGSFPFFAVVGGEVVEVTACTASAGTGPYTQTLTVTRSVNGVPKTHTSGAEIHVFDPALWALGEGGDVVATGDPVYAADINQILGKPMVKLIAQASQNLADNTAVALTFGAGSEEFDTHGFHDETTNPTRITPSVAGYYRLRGAVYLPSRADYVTTYLAIYKNGAAGAPISRPGVSTSSGVRSAEGEALFTANGTTDYFEAVAFQDNTANATAATNASGGFSCYFEAEWQRPL
jgi:hypothetical protein